MQGSLLAQTKLILKRYKIKPRSRLGQNFLIDEGIILRQVKYAAPEGGTVLEIGAGIGNLTNFLIEAAKKVLVIEKDRGMIRILEDRFEGSENLEIICGDVLKVELPSFDVTVSNIPYNICSSLTFRLLKHGFKKAILTYQKEFAERLAARPGTKDYSRLSVAAYYHANVRILETLSPEAFYPKPKVYSAIVELVPKEKPFRVNEEQFFNILRGIFIHRKKTVGSALAHSSGIIKEAGKIIKSLPKSILKKRVFQLLPEEIAEIAGYVHDSI